MNEDNQNQNGNNKKHQPYMMFILFAVIALFFTSMIYSRAGSSSSEEISYTQLLKYIEEDKVESIVFDGDTIQATLKSDKPVANSKNDTANMSQEEILNYYLQMTGRQMSVTYYTAYIRDDELLPLIKEHGVDMKGTISNSTAAVIYNILSFVLPVLLMWALLSFLMRMIDNFEIELPHHRGKRKEQL